MKIKILIAAIALLLGVASGITGTYFYADTNAKKAVMFDDEVLSSFVWDVADDAGEKCRYYVVEEPSETLYVFLETQTIKFRLRKIAPFYYQWSLVDEVAL